jgi:uncharacterized protein (DUF1015 family)
VYFTLGGSPISQLIGFGDTAYRGIGTPFQSPAQNTPPAVSNKHMKTFLRILTFLILTNFSAFGQKLDKEYIDNWITITFINSVIDSSTFYIINGIPIENSKLNQELSKFDKDDLVAVDFIDKETIDSLRIFQPRSGIVVLTTKGNQKKELIKKNLSVAKEKFRKRDIKLLDINSKLGEPVLLVNGKQIFHNKCYDIINSIKTKDIVGINVIERPVSGEMYGSNAINGLIIIRTKEN